MTETEIPQLHFTRDHLMAMTQLLNMLSQRLAEQRERRGRAAYSNAEHAARTADTHEHPVVRPMTEAESQAFTTQAGAPQVPQHGLSVATAPVGQEWGVRAVTPDRDAATVMCPNLTEAARLADYLRAQGNPGLVDEFNELSEQIGHRIATDTTPGVTQSETDAAVESTTAAGTQSERDSRIDLTKHEPLADLAKNVPTSLTATPEWARFEAQFADLTGRGVDPTALVAGVEGLDFDRARRPDALVQWSLDQTARAWDAEHRSTDTGRDDSAAVTADWAKQLDPTSAVDRAAAAEAAGRYGPEIDATLAGTYPGLLTAARTAGNTGEAGDLAQQERERAEALTAESTARTLRGDDVVGGLGGEEDIDREEAAVTQDAEAAEHRGRQSDARGQVKRTRDEKMTAQFTPTCSAATAAPRRTAGRASPSVPVPAQTRARGRRNLRG